MKIKPKKGQILYRLNVGNAARHREQKLTEVSVIHVGRKYFTIQEGDKTYTKIKFHIDDWTEVTNYSPDYILYNSVDEYNDEKEYNELYKNIRDKFCGYNNIDLSLNSIRKINDIIKFDAEREGDKL